MRRRSTGRVWFVLGLAATALVAVPVRAEAIVYSCTILGTAGDDHLVGTSDRDVICGLGGDDVIQGAAGDDVILGGTGADTLKGGPGADRVVGGLGRDTLYGGPGADDLVQGNESPFCDYSNTAAWTDCTPDRERPVVVEARAPRSVDVTSESQTFSLRYHLVDDFKVTTVRLDGDYGFFGDARLVSGTPRDGWWSVRVTVPAYKNPKTLIWKLEIYDRAAQVPEQYTAPRTRVLNSYPDHTPPQVEFLSPEAGDSFDLGQATQAVRVLVHITDDHAGVGWAGAGMELPATSAEGFTNFGVSELVKVSGTRRDGVWRTTMYPWPTLPLGEWEVTAFADDGATWDGDPNRGEATTPVTMLDSRGGTAATLEANVTDEVVDLPDGSHEVHVRVEVSDPGGVRDVDLGFHSPDLSLRYGPTDLTLTAGTAEDGTWTGVVTIPADVPPGFYYADVTIVDDDHIRYYADEVPFSTHNKYLRLKNFQNLRFTD